MLKNDHFTYRVTWSEEDGDYIGLCAEFPSLSWLASEPEAALQGIRQVVAEVVADLQASGDDVPEPLAFKKNTAGDLWCAFRPNYTGDWRRKR